MVAGAVAGGLYAIMASGLVLTYQASGIFNLGHGAVAFATALSFHVLNQPRQAGGLGLPIAQSLIQRQGGLIGFESEPGHTEFSVWLPLGEDE